MTSAIRKYDLCKKGNSTNVLHLNKEQKEEMEKMPYTFEVTAPDPAIGVSRTLNSSTVYLAQVQLALSHFRVRQTFYKMKVVMFSVCAAAGAIAGNYTVRLAAPAGGYAPDVTAALNDARAALGHASMLENVRFSVSEASVPASVTNRIRALSMQLVADAKSRRSFLQTTEDDTVTVLPASGFESPAASFEKFAASIN